ncbi:MAG: hypothetical protein MUF41_03100 [Sphingopyxis sp.]|jgi:hypothetical protein|nr:hypothetical protein [Sphingopyxis sp.]
MNNRRQTLFRIALVAAVIFAILAGYGLVKNAGPRAEMRAKMEAAEAAAEQQASQSAR